MLLEEVIHKTIDFGHLMFYATIHRSSPSGKQNQRSRFDSTLPPRIDDLTLSTQDWGYPNILGAHLTLAAVYGELGQAAEAQKEVAEVLRLNPNFSLEVHRQRMPIKDPAVLERHIAALRKAGLK